MLPREGRLPRPPGPAGPAPRSFPAQVRAQVGPGPATLTTLTPAAHQAAHRAGPSAHRRQGRTSALGDVPTPHPNSGSQSRGSPARGKESQLLL